MLVRNRGNMYGKSVEIGAKGGKLTGCSVVGAGAEWGKRMVDEGSGEGEKVDGEE